jgi:DNA-directed RNA polymerase specialized sigma24 family protein
MTAEFVQAAAWSFEGAAHEFEAQRNAEAHRVRLELRSLNCPLDLYDSLSAGNLTTASERPPKAAAILAWVRRAPPGCPSRSGSRMESSGTQTLLNKAGQPLSARVQEALRNVLPQLRKRFPSLNTDDLHIVEILEDAGCRIEDHERVSGLVDNLEAYAWVTVQNVAKSKLQRSSMRLVRSTLPSHDSEAVLDRLPARFGSAEQIESDILYDEILAQLPDEDQRLCGYKKLGFSVREIAREQGISIMSVNTHFYRIKRKIRALQESGADASFTKTPQATKPRPA